MTTADGYVIELDDVSAAAPHPKYGVPSYGALIRVPLLPAQRELFRALHDRSGIAEIHRSTRSSVDQLSLFGGDSASTQMFLDGDDAMVKTRIALLDPHPQNKILDALRAVVHTQKAQYLRLLLAPKESKHGERGLPVGSEHEIWYDYEQLPQSVLERLWLGGPGRELIQHAKRKRPMRTHLTKGDFLLAEMNAMDPEHPSREHLWVLKRKVRGAAWKDKTHLRHGDACGFDPHRSTGNRQGEYFYMGDAPLSTERLQMIAEEHELDFENSNGSQLTGV